MKVWIMVYEGDDSPGASPTDAIGPFDTEAEAEGYQQHYKRLESWGHIVRRRKPTHVVIYSVAGDDGADHITHCPPTSRAICARAIAEAEAKGVTVT